MVKAALLCAVGNGAVTERERDWLFGYRAACGDSDHVLDAVRGYDDSDRIEDIVGLPSMKVTVRAVVHDALRICASDGPLTTEEIERVRDGARRMGVSRDIVDGVQQIVLDEAALRRRENVPGLMMSLNMLIEFGDAFDFTGADYRGWCEEVGFRSVEILPLAGPVSAAIAYK